MPHFQQMKRMLLVGGVQAAILLAATILIFGGLALRGQAAEVFPQRVSVPLIGAEADPAPGDELLAGLRRSCPSCMVEIENDVLIVSRPSEDLDLRPVFSTLVEHGYSISSFSIGRSFNPMLAVDHLEQATVFAWFLLTLPVLLLVASLYLRPRTLPAHLQSRPSVNVRQAWIIGAVTGLGLVLVITLVDLASSALGSPIIEQPWVTALAEGRPFGPWLLIGVAVIAAPVAEELFYRGWVLPFLRPLGVPMAVGASALVFAIAHGHPPGIPVYLVLGIGLALLYLKTETLLAPITAHAVHNFVAVLLVL